MKRIKRAVFVISVSLAALLVSGAQAYAMSITLDPTNITLDATMSGSSTVGGTTWGWDYGTCNSCISPTGVYLINPNSNPDAADLSAITGTTVTGPSYKDNDPGGSESGSFAGSYTTTFFPAGDPEGATISYDSPGSVLTGANWLTVKDGNADPSIYLFDISGWDGMSDIIMQNFWVGEGQLGRGAISNVGIWGGNGTSLPEPSSLMILGIGLLALGVTRRRLPI
jgi:hypothetical protein